MKKTNTIILIISAFCFALLVYFSIKPDYYCIPVKFGKGNCPLAKVEIEGHIKDLDIDIGSKFALSLEKSILSKISKKKFHGIVSWKDAMGNIYQSPSYIVPKIRIGNLTLRNLEANQENEDFLLNTILGDVNLSREQQGALGRPILEKYNLLLDFPRSRIILCNNLNILKKLGFKFETMVKTSLEEGCGIIISVETDFGKKKFDFDTGSTFNLIRAPLLDEKKNLYEIESITTQFIIGERDFGPISLSSYNISPEFDDLDGIIGMEFLKDHVVYIDYRNKVVYIGDETISFTKLKDW